MARPKKQRFFEGVLLPDNLYPDPKKRVGKWQYVRPDGTKRSFSTVTTEEAVKLARQANEGRKPGTTPKKTKASRYNLEHYVEAFILDQESKNLSLKEKRSWNDRKNYLRGFARDMGNGIPQQLGHEQLHAWWDSMAYHAQHNRQTEIRRFINYLMLRDLTPRLKFNPFTTNTSAPKLEKKAKPAKRRARLDMPQYWVIYNQAGEMGYTFLQTAMAVSLMTTMRREDVCQLRFDHLEEDCLKKVINKSLHQRGEANAAYLSWNLERYPMLRQVIKTARECSLVHARCPYVVSHKFQRKIRAEGRTHGFQVLPGYVSNTFLEVRNKTGLYNNLPADQDPPTFHEIRSLASKQFKDAGYPLKQVSQLMAHTDEKITEEVYQSGHTVEWTPIDLILSESDIGGSFS